MAPSYGKVDFCQIPTWILVDYQDMYKISQKFSLTNEGAWQFIDEDP